MIRKRITVKRMFCFLLILFEKTSGASISNGLTDELRFLHREIGFLREENHNQNIEIANLKNMMEPKNDALIIPANQQLPNISVDQHNKTMANGTVMVDDDNSPGKLTKGARNKRPVRLLPPHVYMGDRKNETEIRRFYGPPTNCSDLKLLGYTLNGYYQVKQPDHSSNNDNTKLETIYCAFKQPEGTFNLSLVERRIGHLQLIPHNDKSVLTNEKLSLSNNNVGNHPLEKFVRGVYFYASRKIKNGEIGNHLKVMFNTVFLNSGGGFNNETGIFTAPKDGVYQFFFKGTVNMKETADDSTISLYHNGKSSVSSYVTKSGRKNGPFVVMEKTMIVSRGDTVHLAVSSKGSQTIAFHGDTDDSMYTATSFSGSLLEEVIIITKNN